MIKHTRDVFSILEVPTAPPSFDDILKFIYEDRDRLTYDVSNKSQTGTFERGLHGTTSYYDMNLFHEKRYFPLMKHIMGAIYQTYRQFSPVDFNALQAWWTVYEKGAFIPRHTHSNSMISGAYYLRQPQGAGPIKFFNPIGPLINHFYHPDLIFQVAADIDIEPRTGTLLLFPGWLEHETQANQSDEDKIIVSFNLTLKETNQTNFSARESYSSYGE